MTRPTPDPQPLARFVGLSVLLHAVPLLAVVGVTWLYLALDRPTPEPLEASSVTLVKKPERLPEPVPAGPPKTPAPLTEPPIADTRLPEPQDDLPAAFEPNPVGDAEIVAWQSSVQGAFFTRFTPLPAPVGTSCVVLIRFEPETGRILSHELQASSGILAFDAAALRAVAETATLPLPPVRYRALLAARGVGIRFSPP